MNRSNVVYSQNGGPILVGPSLRYFPVPFQGDIIFLSGFGNSYVCIRNKISLTPEGPSRFAKSSGTAVDAVIFLILLIVSPPRLGNIFEYLICIPASCGICPIFKLGRLNDKYPVRLVNSEISPNEYHFLFIG